MSKVSILAAFVASVALTSTASAATESNTFKCTVVDGSGKGLIKENKGSCATSKHQCASHNEKGDAEAWLKVSEEECKTINDAVKSGDWSKVDAKHKELIEGAK